MNADHAVALESLTLVSFCAWPVATTALWTVVFLALAIWRFGREEF